MARRIEVDWGLCESNGVCEQFLPDAFRINDDDVLEVDAAQVLAATRGALEHVVRMCPRAALTLREEDAA